MAETAEDRGRIRATIEARRFSKRMKRALGRVLNGESYRIAATCERVGYREVHRNASTIKGLRDAHNQAWRDGWGRAFPALWRHHVRDLDEAG